LFFNKNIRELFQLSLRFFSCHETVWDSGKRLSKSLKLVFSL
jgi:hypothetical protein